MKLEKPGGLAAKARRAAALLRRETGLRPRLAIVLGSGFAGITSRLQAVEEIAYRALPGFPQPRVPGHEGKLVLGTLGGTGVCLLSGRAHYYEGYPMEVVTFPMRVLAEFGFQTVLLTNAAGAINDKFRVGDFMCIEDHINLMGANPLRGVTGKSGGNWNFLDLSCVYAGGVRTLLRRAARQVGARLHRGVYAAVSGPTYETPAEVRALARLGADAVGMSTVPEAIVAHSCGLEVAGLSCLTNWAAGKSNAFPSHADVLVMGRRVGRQAAALLEGFARLYGRGLACEIGPPRVKVRRGKSALER